MAPNTNGYSYTKQLVTKIDSIEQGVEAFQNQVRQQTAYPGVYAFYLKETGEPLYVGQSKNIHQRLLDHFVIDPNNTDLRTRIEDDEELDIPVSGGELWDHIHWKWVHVADRDVRGELEDELEEDLNPRYSST